MSASNKPAATGNHIAGEPDGLVQRCVICGGIVCDNRNAHMMAAPEGHPFSGPLFWGAGPINVIQHGGGCTYTSIGHSEDLPDCTP